MRRITLSISLLAGIVLFCGAYPAFAQKRVHELSEFAEQLRSSSERLRAEAVDRARLHGLPLRRRLRSGKLVELKWFTDEGRPLYYVSDNLDAADTLSTDELWPGGSLGLVLDGSGHGLGIWDGGNVRATHQEFNSRVTNSDSSPLSNHATHVAGTMVAAGIYPDAIGMSFAATLRAWDWSGDETEMAQEQLLPDQVRVSNHSYGYISGWIYDFYEDGLWAWFGDVQTSTEEDGIFGLYEESSHNWDQIAYDSPFYLIVKSSGNDRNDAGPGPGALHWHLDGGGFLLSTDSHPTDGGASGYDTIIGGSASAKNIITVGAVSDIPGGYLNSTDVVMSSFSGWGPTDDGRIKPDIVANGINLRSSVASSDTSYASYSGTSMSAPNVAGSLGLLGQHADNLYGAPLLASTMKALVIHTADESGSAPGPDYRYGWGLMNTAAAARLMTDDASAGSTGHIYEISLAEGATEIIQFEIDGAQPFRATAVWTDPPGTASGSLALDPPELKVVNDIDLRVIGPDAVSREPWVLDPANPSTAATTGDNIRDNVEQVHVENPLAGTYTVEISHKNALHLGDPQVVSLIVSGNTVDPASNIAPVISSVTAAPAIITDSETSQLDAAASDPDGGPAALSYVWTVPPGGGTVDDAHVSGPTYTPPDVGTSQVFTLTVEVYDGADTTSGTVDVTVHDTAAAGDVVLTVGTMDPGLYGHNFGTGEHETELVATFAGTAMDLEFSLTGYDIDYSDEVSVYLNGVLLGYLSPGPNNNLNAGDTFSIPAAQQSGENQIRIVQKRAGWTWGVKSLLLSEAGAPPPPPPGDVVLTVGTMDPGLYGHNFGTGEHETELVATFAGTAMDLEFSLTGYDIDYSDEVSVYLNGVLLGYLSPGPNNNLNAGDTFSIPAAQQSGENQIRIVQKRAGWTWGVKSLLLSEAGAPPPPPPGDVVLTVGTMDPGLYGHNFGTGEHETELVATFAGTAMDLEFSLTGYDIDYSDEVSVYLNGVLLGYLSPGPNNNLNAGDTFSIPAAQQSGENQIRIVQKRAGWTWGVKSLLLQP